MGKLKKSSLAISKVRGILLLAIMICATIGLASAVNYFMIHGTFTVPSNASIALYQNDGVTPISNGADITSLSSWTGSQFTLAMVIKNTGNTVLNTGLNATGVPAGWTLQIVGNGTLNAGAMQSVTIIVIPPNTNGGTTSGDIDLWLTG